MNSPAVIAAIVVVCGLTIAVSVFGLRLSRTTSDFYVASRAVTPWWNASAIGGEYLSAASFLGVAGLVYVAGLDMLWFPVGYTLGYVVLLVLVAAPLRRSGAYTLPDFAEVRLGSRRLRGLCTLLVVMIGWLYLLPQLQGAGIALTALTGAPSWAGGLLVTVIVTLNVLAGGMRSITLVQAIQYWIKLVAIAVPAVILIVVWLRSGQGAPPAVPSPGVGAPPLVVPGQEAGGEDMVTAGRRLYASYSTLLALCLGTMGLPHVVVRFYTNPDGRAARRTTLVVIGLLGIFYVFTPVYGVLGRVYVPSLPDGSTGDSIVLLLPSAMAPGSLGTSLLAILAAGAFAAFLSTASGLTVAMAGALDQDVVRPTLSRLTGGEVGGITSFRIATLVATAMPCLLLWESQGIGLATTVGLAFALAASTFCPLLVLGVWWRRLTRAGIAAGMTVGAVLATGAAAVSVLGLARTGWIQTLASQPAAWTVPIAFLVTIGVSLVTQSQVPEDVVRILFRLHTPESVQLPRTRR